MSDLPPEMLDPSTPPDVVVTDDAAAAHHRSDARRRPRRRRPPARRPCPPTRRTRWSPSATRSPTACPAARCSTRRCRGRRRSPPPSASSTSPCPTYGGPLDGLPLNIESLRASPRGRSSATTSTPRADAHAAGAAPTSSTATRTTGSAGPGSDPPPTDVRYDNVGIYGWDVRDALSYTAARAAAARRPAPRRRPVRRQAGPATTTSPRCSVLAPFGVDATQLDAGRLARRQRRHRHADRRPRRQQRPRCGRAASAVGGRPPASTTSTRTAATTSGGRPTSPRSTPPSSATLRTIPAQRVVLTTVPHVTIAPIASGVNPDDPGEKWRPGSRYFPYYTDPWIDDDDFRPSQAPPPHPPAGAGDRLGDRPVQRARSPTPCAAARTRGPRLVRARPVRAARLARLPSLRRRTRRRPGCNDWVPYELPHADRRSRHPLLPFRRGRAGGRAGCSGSTASIRRPPATGSSPRRSSTCSPWRASRARRSTSPPLLDADTLNSDPPALVDEVFELIAPFAARWVSRQ